MLWLKMKFQKIYLVGSGSICISILKSLLKDSYNPVMLLYKEHNLSLLGNFVKNNSIKNYSFDNRLDRVQAYRIIKDACNKINKDLVVGTHTLRKTFAYPHYTQFKDIAFLQKI